MTNDRGSRPGIERVASTGKARHALFLAAAGLLSVVWFGLSGRADVAVAPPEPPDVALASPSPASPQPTAPPRLTHAPSAGPAAEPSLRPSELGRGGRRSVPDEAAGVVAPAPRLEARLYRDEQLEAVVGLGGRAQEGPLTGHVLFHQRYGPQAELRLAWNTLEGDQPEVLASMGLERRLLRRGFPEEFSGEFRLDWPHDGEGQHWRYRAYPSGTGMGILMVIEAELLSGSGPPLVWTCWSQGEVC